MKSGIQTNDKTEQAAYSERAGEDTGSPFGRGDADPPGAVGDGEITPQDAAAYIMEMAIELKQLAKSARLSFLAYLLGFVVEEAEAQKRTQS